MKNTLRGLAIALAILITALGLLVVAVFARVDLYRGWPGIVLPPVHVIAAKPRQEQSARAAAAPGTGRDMTAARMNLLQTGRDRRES